MLRQTLLLLALAATAPALSAQQPMQQPASVAPKAQSNASQAADTTKSKAKRHRAKKGKAGKSTAAPKDTSKAKP
jgi:hypothetical protein